MRNLIGCCLIHLVIGSVYASSVLYSTIMECTGWPDYILISGFSMTILALGFSAAFYQRFFAKDKKKEILRISGLLYFVSLGLQWYVFRGHIDIPIYLIAGLVNGMALGILYACTISIASSLSKEHVGVYSGCVVMSFGLGSLLAAKSYAFLLGFGAACIYIYYLFMIVLFLAALCLINTEDVICTPGKFGDLLHNTQWRSLYIVMFLNIFVGIALLSNLAGLSQKMGFTGEEAVFLVALAGLSNGLGRIVYATASDYCGRARVLCAILFVQAIVLCTVVFDNSLWTYAIVIIISVYGGGFALLPGICKEIFDNRSDEVYGSILSAWGIAGIAGPLALQCYGLFALACAAVIAFFVGCRCFLAK